MFLIEWVLVLVGMLAASWASHSRPRRLKDHRRQHAAVLEQWSHLARRRGLRFEGSGSPPWVPLAGRWDERPVVVSVSTGGGWGAEREFATQITMTLRCPIDPALALWRVGQPAPARRLAAARVSGWPLMVSGDLRLFDDALLNLLVQATDGNATLSVQGGALRVRYWGLPAELEAHIAGLARIAERVEAAICAPWRVAAEAQGLACTIEQDNHLVLAGEGLTVRVAPTHASLTLDRALPGVRRIVPRGEGRAATPIGNPIADRFLLVDAEPEVIARLREAEATALAMEVIYAAPAGAVSAQGVAISLPAGCAAALGEWTERTRALADALTKT